MTFADLRSILRRSLGIIGFHLHEWRYGSELVTHSGEPWGFRETRFCGIAACQRYEIRAGGHWVEKTSGYPGI